MPKEEKMIEGISPKDGTYHLDPHGVMPSDWELHQEEHGNKIVQRLGLGQDSGIDAVMPVDASNMEATPEIRHPNERVGIAMAGYESETKGKYNFATKSSIDGNTFEYFYTNDHGYEKSFKNQFMKKMIVKVEGIQIDKNDLKVINEHINS